MTESFKSRCMKIIQLIPVLSLICSATVFAMQEGSKHVHVLAPVVISANRVEVPEFDVPQDVSVITRDKIMASPFERVEDIVRSVSGIYNFRHSGQQTNGIVSPLIMRGVGKNRVLVLVDGVPQNDNFNNAIAWVAWGNIPRQAISRIEIVRGPSSALYGSEGLGGVINIITRKPAKKRETSLRSEVGSGDSYAIYGFHSQKKEKLGVLFTGGYEDSDGFYMEKDPKDYSIKRYRTLYKGFGKITYDVSPQTNLSLAALYYNQDTGQGRKYFHSDLRLDQYWLNMTHKTGSFIFKTMAYLNRADKTAYQDSAKDNYSSLKYKENFGGTNVWGCDFQGTWTGSKKTRITFGTAYKEARLDYDVDYIGEIRDSGARGTQRSFSPFVNFDVFLLNKKLILNTGLRYDWIETLDGKNWDTVASAGKSAYDNKYDTNSEGSLSPKLGLAWHLDDMTTLKMSGGKGFRAPSLFELYKVHVRGGGTYYREASPDLNSEKIWSYDMEIERSLSDSLSGKLTFYQSFARDYIGDNLIGTGSFGGGKTRYEYQLNNIGKVHMHGIETELQWNALNDLTFSGNYTYNISKIHEDENNPQLKGNYLPNDPRHKLHIGFRYENPDFVNLYAMFNYYADIYYNNENSLKTDNYWTADLAVSHEFFKRFTVYMNAENIFNERYPISRSISKSELYSPGIIITCGVRFNI